MSLTPGSRLGGYEVIETIGAGGMGEVFRARDLQLGREVALKILPDHLSNDAARVARFEREARTLATLNHPHIAQIYGFEQFGATAVLVMELVEGEDLSQRIARGVIPIDEALAIARQVAEALDAAHGLGIVHRDLKPANVKLREDGTAKVLDFGLAKAVETDTALSTADTLLSPAMTMPGEILGTAAYMAPEQARGLPVDKRADIWAFGCLLYELLTGRRPFHGDTPTDVIVAIIEREPEWQVLPAETPSGVRQLVQRCLQKDRRHRLRDIGDAIPELVSTARPEPPPTSVTRRPGVVAAAIFAGLLLGAAATWFALSARTTPVTPSAAVPAPTVRFVLPPPPRTLYGARISEIEVITVAVAPDGQSVAFIAAREAEAARIWVRPLADDQAREIPGTDGAISLFWSPDASSVAFVASGQLKRVAVAGGVPVKVCDVPGVVGVTGTWGRGGDILFSTVNGPAIARVPASGGTPVEIVKAAEGRVLWPQFLPDGQRFLYFASFTGMRGEIRLANLDGASTTLIEAVSQAHWVDPNWIVFVREGTLLAQQIDLQNSRPSGDPVAILGSVTYSAATGWSNVSAAAMGMIVAQTMGNESRMAWFAPDGREIARVGDPGLYFTLRLSHDNSTLLFARSRPELGTLDIWSLDLARATERRVTDSPGMETGETWLPGGQAIVYAAADGGAPNLFRRDLATGQAQRLLTSPRFQFPTDVTADGTTVIYQQRTAEGSWDLMQVPLNDPGRASAVLASTSSEVDARLSPDGTRVAFSSDQAGRQRVYVLPFPVTGTPTAVSPDGGTRARWGRDGRVLYYLSPARQLMAVAFDAAGRAGAPRELFDAANWLDFDVARDGRFIAVVSTARSGERPLTVILNWRPGS